MRILVYKRTHVGDPDSSGQFGVHGCMGEVRGYDYDAVIGVGGMGQEARSHGIEGRINWIGVGPNRDWARSRHLDPRGPQVSFEKFCLWETQGPLLHVEAPLLARRLYEKKARFVIGGLSADEQKEAEAILALIDVSSQREQPLQASAAAKLASRRKCDTGRVC